jgi:RNA polymerase sigma factor (sigma-70 family)
MRCAPAAASEIEAGTVRALAAMYDLHAAVVLSLCRARLAGAGLDEAEDACQETFMRAHRKVLEGKQPNDEGHVRRWLYAIARRVCRERLRSRRRRSHHELRAHRNNGAIAGTAGVSHSVDALAREEAMSRMSDALSRLPEREQLAIHLHYLEVDPVRAASEAMRVSRSGYYKLLARARAHLAARMQLPRQAGHE